MTAAQALARIIASYTALEHVATEGWSKGEGDPVQMSKSDYQTHDPEAVKKVDSVDDQLTRLANSIDDFLDDRDIEVNGCHPPKDCNGQLRPGDSRYRSCGHLGAGGCELGRR